MKAQDFIDWISAEPRAFLAPMAGVSDACYRSMYSDSADLCYTEMVSATGLAYGSKETWALAEPHPLEEKLAVQIFGHEPELMAAQALALQEKLGDKLMLIDVNMACPVAKVCKKGEGSALLKDPKRAQAIIAALSKELDCAISAKIRTGLKKEEPLFMDFALGLEASGASAIALHGRSAGQAYRGESDREAIAQLAQALTIPLIGSGDVYSYKDAQDLYDRGCKAVFVARGSYGNPWIFEEIKELRPSDKGLKEKLACAREHLKRAQEFNLHAGKMRKILSWYLKGAPLAAHWRSCCMACSSYDEFLSLIDEIESLL